jgi:hypothetical protein
MNTWGTLLAIRMLAKAMARLLTFTSRSTSIAKPNINTWKSGSITKPNSLNDDAEISLKKVLPIKTCSQRKSCATWIVFLSFIILSKIKTKTCNPASPTAKQARCKQKTCVLSCAWTRRVYYFYIQIISIFYSVKLSLWKNVLTKFCCWNLSIF